MKFGTKIIHTGKDIDPVTGASSIPIYHASTFYQFDLETPQAYDYARSGNPTREALENAIAVLEGGERGLAFASGIAAISSAFLLFSSGDHLLVCDDVYGGTYRFLTKILSHMDITFTFVDMTDLGQVKAAVRPNTRAWRSTPVGKFIKPKAPVPVLSFLLNWNRERLSSSC